MTRAILYHGLRPIVVGLSYLPLGVLYGFSDVLFLVSFYLLRYRRRVVQQNLRNAFPDRSEAERARMEQAFFRHFCDLIVETVKLISMRAADLRARVQVEGLETVAPLERAGRSAFVASSHLGNWEWMGAAMAQTVGLEVAAVYKSLANPYWDGFVYRMRSRFGLQLIPMRDALRALMARRDRPSLIALVADQTPFPEDGHWMTFLNQETPVYRGIAVGARMLDYPLLYAGMRRIRRGHYRITLEMLVERPRELSEGEILERYMHRLEQDILAQPESWLWSHRRWKHQRPAELPSQPSRNAG